MTKIRVQHPDGVVEYPAYGTHEDVLAAIGTGDIAYGQDIVYRGYIVQLMDDKQMLLVDMLQPNMLGVQIL